MDLKKEYIVVMVEEDNTETYEYFDTEKKSIEYAKKMIGEYKKIGVLLVDYVEKTEEFIWESEE